MAYLCTTRADINNQPIIYAELLFNRFILIHFKIGAIEVHVLFDSPSLQAFNPKSYDERTRRDGTRTSSISYVHITFPPSMLIPNNWSLSVKCRECKQPIYGSSITSLLSESNSKLGAHQNMGNLRWSIIPNQRTIHTPYTTNIEEADMRIWRHAYQSKPNKILIYPQTQMCTAYDCP